MDILKYYGEKIAKNALKIGAIKLNPTNPFQWASGYRMPIYNDNRMFLYYPNMREINTISFIELIKNLKIKPNIIAGTSTAGISPGTSLADKLNLPFIYVRNEPKDHGLRNQIEGIDSDEDLKLEKVVLIEDLISTGGSSVSAVQAIRDANGECNYCFSIFNYGFKKAEEMFQGKRFYDKEKTEFLTSPCQVKSLLTYDILLKIAKENNYLTGDQIKLLKEWRTNPFGWGQKHGFPKVEKK